MNIGLVMLGIATFMSIGGAILTNKWSKNHPRVTRKRLGYYFIFLGLVWYLTGATYHPTYSLSSLVYTCLGVGWLLLGFLSLLFKF